MELYIFNIVCFTWICISREVEFEVYWILYTVYLDQIKFGSSVLPDFVSMYMIDDKKHHQFIEFKSAFLYLQEWVQHFFSFFFF